MATKVDVAANSRMIDDLLVGAQPVGFLQLGCIPFPDILQESLMLLEPLLRCLEADERSCPHVAGGDGFVQGQDFGRDGGWVGRGLRHLQLGTQSAQVSYVLCSNIVVQGLISNQ